MSTVFAINHVDESFIVTNLMTEGTNQQTHQELLLRGIDLNNEIMPCFNRLIQSRVWKSIEISDCRGNVDVGVQYALSNNKVKALRINGDNVQNCFKGLESNQSLEYARVTTNWTKDNILSLTRGIERNRGLQILDFRWSSFESQAMETLATGLAKNMGLTELLFAGCGLENDSIANLVDALKFHPTLYNLELNGNKCRELPVIPTSCNLRKVDFRSQKVSIQDHLDITSFAGALALNTSLISIKLSENNLNDADATVLARAMSKNNVLKELHLSRNKITDKGIILLAERFIGQQTLTKLSLWGNPFGEVGANALLEGLKHNCTLQDLELFQQFSVSPKVAHMLRANRAGRRIFAEDPNSVPTGLWPHVFERVNQLSFPSRSKSEEQVDALYSMLRGSTVW